MKDLGSREPKTEWRGKLWIELEFANSFKPIIFLTYCHLLCGGIFEFFVELFAENISNPSMTKHSLFLPALAFFLLCQTQCQATSTAITVTQEKNIKPKQQPIHDQKIVTGFVDIGAESGTNTCKADEIHFTSKEKSESITVKIGDDCHFKAAIPLANSWILDFFQNQVKIASMELHKTHLQKPNSINLEYVSIQNEKAVATYRKRWHATPLLSGYLLNFTLIFCNPTTGSRREMRDENDPPQYVIWSKIVEPKLSGKRSKNIWERVGSVNKLA